MQPFKRTRFRELGGLAIRSTVAAIAGKHEIPDAIDQARRGDAVFQHVRKEVVNIRETSSRATIH